MHGHVDEERAENEQVSAIIDGVLDECSLYFARDREAPRAGIRLHEWQKKPGNASKEKIRKNWQKVKRCLI